MVGGCGSGQVVARTGDAHRVSVEGRAIEREAVELTTGTKKQKSRESVCMCLYVGANQKERGSHGDEGIPQSVDAPVGEAKRTVRKKGVTPSWLRVWERSGLEHAEALLGATVRQ